MWGVVWDLCVERVSFGVGFGLRCVGFRGNFRAATLFCCKACDDSSACHFER